MYLAFGKAAAPTTSLSNDLSCKSNIQSMVCNVCHDRPACSRELSFKVRIVKYPLGHRFHDGSSQRVEGVLSSGSFMFKRLLDFVQGAALGFVHKGRTHNSSEDGATTKQEICSERAFRQKNRRCESNQEVGDPV